MNASFCCSAIVVSFLWISLCPVRYVFARLTVFDFEILWLLLEQTVVRMRKNGKGVDNHAFTTTRANKRDPFVVCQTSIQIQSHPQHDARLMKPIAIQAPTLLEVKEPLPARHGSGAGAVRPASEQAARPGRTTTARSRTPTTRRAKVPWLPTILLLIDPSWTQEVVNNSSLVLVESEKSGGAAGASQLRPGRPRWP